MSTETTSSTTDGELPRVTQLTVTRDMAHFFAILVGIARAIHDQDEERWIRRSGVLQTMLWEGIAPCGNRVIEHDAFHILEEAAFDLLKATDPEAYKEAFGERPTPNELRAIGEAPDREGQPNFSFAEFIKHFIASQPQDEGGDTEGTKPSGGGQPAKKARKRRRKDS